MSKGIKRRDFVKSGIVLGTAALAGGFRGQRPLDSQTPRKASPDLAVVTGSDPFLAANKGLEALGGMKRFVKPGATVGLLINAPAWWSRRAAELERATDSETTTETVEKPAAPIAASSRISLAQWGRK